MAALVACVVACDSSTAPSGQLVFETGIDTTGYPPLVVANGYVEYRAAYKFPCWPYDVTGHLVTRRPNVVEVQVVGSDRCIYSVEGFLLYRARVQDLAPGSYQLRVIHSRDGGSADTVLNTALTLPPG